MKGLKRLTIAFRAILLLGLAVAATNIIAAQAPPVEVKIDPMSVPDITVQSEDYAIARSHFHTDLLQKGPAPYQECTSAKPPVGITEIKYASGFLQLKAWISRPTANDKQNLRRCCSCMVAFALTLQSGKILSLFETLVS